MARKARELGALEVSRLRDPGFHAIGGVSGLHMQITPSGARTWILRVTIGAKRRDMGLGGFPNVTLAGAREKAREARLKIEQGIDPILERQKLASELLAQQAQAITFEEATRQYIAGRSDEWKNPKHKAQWSATLITYAHPVMGKLLVSDIEQGHVMKVLEPIWRDKTETATRVRGRIESVLNWATVRGYRSGLNPARWKGHLDSLLPRPTKIAKKSHHQALPIDLMPDFLERLRQRQGMAARALEFAIFTAARSGEVRELYWHEIDLDKAIWTVPAERMKAEKEHVVPLSRPALEILKSKLVDSGEDPAGHELIFVAPRGGKLSDMALTEVLRRMEVEAVPHGFRSTFRDWVAERTNHPNEVAEMALAHAIPNAVEAAYRRGNLFEKRRALMDDWAAFCELKATTNTA